MTTTGSHSRRFWRLTSLNILTNLTVPLASLVDTALLGHLPEIHFLAGVALASILFEYVYWAFGFLRMGTTGLTAQAHGAKMEVEAHHVLYRSLIVGFSIGLIILACRVPLRELGFALLSGSAPVETAGRQYFDARIWGAPAVLANFAFLGWYLGRAESRLALLMTAVAHIVNVLLDYLFIVHLGLAAKGAGFATAISQYAMLLTGVAIFRYTSRPLRRRRDESLPFFEPRSILSRTALKDLTSLNANIFVRTVLLISAFAIFLNLSAVFGTIVLAANTILYRIQMLAAYFVDGVAFATESLAGIYRGAGDDRRLVALRRKALRTGVTLTLPFAIVVLFAPRPVLSILTSHSAALGISVAHTPWLALALLLGSGAYVYDGYFLGLTRGRELRNAMIASSFVVFLPLSLIAFSTASNHLLWLAMSGFLAARWISLAWLDRRLSRSHPTVRDEESAYARQT